MSGRTFLSFSRCGPPIPGPTATWLCCACCIARTPRHAGYATQPTASGRFPPPSLPPPERHPGFTSSILPAGESRQPAASTSLPPTTGKSCTTARSQSFDSQTAFCKFTTCLGVREAAALPLLGIVMGRHYAERTHSFQASPIIPSDFVRIEAAALERPRPTARRSDARRPSPTQSSESSHRRGRGENHRHRHWQIRRASPARSPPRSAPPAPPHTSSTPLKAVHGDIGMVAPGDTISRSPASGETEELLRILPALQRMEQLPRRPVWGRRQWALSAGQHDIFLDTSRRL